MYAYVIFLRAYGFRCVAASERIAFFVLITSILSVIILAVTAVWVAESGQRSETTQFVFTSALPLLGAWVGAVLA